VSDIFQISIDGPVASGKGTVARGLARRFGFLCLDTGAIYRGITVYFIDNNIDHNDYVAFNRALGEINLTIECIEGETFVFLNGEDVTRRLRTNEVSTRVFHVAKLVAVRAKVREIQQSVAAKSTLVCEGRDITSVVFPNARFKFYLTASVRERARRRRLELLGKGEDIDIRELAKQIAERDRADMTRESSPLVCVPDAVKIDATKITAAEVIGRMERRISGEILEDN
jgi:cytidylate kinase